MKSIVMGVMRFMVVVVVAVILFLGLGIVLFVVRG
jgi:hypothetical protein